MAIAQETVYRAKMEASVAASLGLEALCRKAGVDVLVLNDIEPVLMRSLGLRPGFTPCPNDYTDSEGKTIVSRDERFARTDYKHVEAPFAWHTVSPAIRTASSGSAGT